MERPDGDGEVTLEEFVRRETADLLRRFAFEVGRTARFGDADAVHDLRVSIRRLRSCLRVFRDFFPHGDLRKIRARLGELMDLAGRVRDCDVAIKLLSESGVAEIATLLEPLKAERRQASADLLGEARRWFDRGFHRKWRAQLKL